MSQDHVVYYSVRMNYFLHTFIFKRRALFTFLIWEIWVKRGIKWYKRLDALGQEDREDY